MSRQEKKKTMRIPWQVSGEVRIALLTAVVLGLMAGVFSRALEATNRTEFCVSCHSMRQNYEQYKETAHYRNRHGVAAGCPDCHVPKKLIPKLKAKVLALKDVYHEFAGTVDTPEKFEARKWEMANRVWRRMKANDSRACRNCHAFDRMALDEQDPSARRRHLRAMQTGKTCIDCHTGIAHEEPDPPDEAEG